MSASEHLPIYVGTRVRTFSSSSYAHVWAFNGDWRDLTYDLRAQTVFSLKSYNGSLFAGVAGRSSSAADVMRLNPGTGSWVSVMHVVSDGSPLQSLVGTSSDMPHLAIFQEKLYAFTWVLNVRGSNRFRGTDVSIFNPSSGRFEHIWYDDEFSGDGLGGTFVSQYTERGDSGPRLIVGDESFDHWRSFDGTSMQEVDANDSSSCVWCMFDDPDSGLHSGNEYGWVYRSQDGAGFTSHVNHTSPWNTGNVGQNGSYGGPFIYEDISDSYNLVPAGNQTRNSIWTMFKLGDQLFAGTCDISLSFSPGLGVGLCDIRRWTGNTWITADNSNKVVTRSVDRYGQGFISSVQIGNVAYVGTGVPYYDFVEAQESLVFAFDGETLTELTNPFHGGVLQFDDGVQCMTASTVIPPLRRRQRDDGAVAAGGRRPTGTKNITTSRQVSLRQGTKGTYW